MTADVDVVSLGSLTSIGEGGEGEVFRCSARSGLVFKRFKDAVRPELDENGLVGTVNLLSTMSSQDRTRVESRAMWPVEIVRESGRMVGFLMPVLPDEVKCRHGRKEAMRDGLTDWNKLTLRHTWMGNPNLDSTVRKFEKSKADHRLLILLLKDLAETFEILHRYDIIAGDVSGRNILWHTNGATAEALLIDCDGFRRAGSRAVTAPKQSPDWRDPELVGETTIQSDLYKLGLALYRAYYSDGLGYPETGHRRYNEKRADVLELAKRSVSPADRPTASDWVNLLAELADDRPRVPIPRPNKISPPPKSVRPEVPFGAGATDRSSAASHTSGHAPTQQSGRETSERPIVEFRPES